MKMIFSAGPPRAFAGAWNPKRRCTSAFCIYNASRRGDAPFIQENAVERALILSKGK
ncbi:MAG: hypothetical protein GY859_03575 [Desulfobacterales bacterium]|nr:hypothetical protein [Desulfobacterales bacterium]